MRFALLHQSGSATRYLLSVQLFQATILTTPTSKDTVLLLGCFQSSWAGFVESYSGLSLFEDDLALLFLKMFENRVNGVDGK